MGNWIIPCNAKYYDVVGAFDKLKQIDWRQSTKVEVDDTVYIYVSRPYSSIMFKCKAIDVNINNPRIDDAEFMREPFTNYGNYMRLELVEKYPQEQYNLEVLRAHGIKGSIQGPIRVPEGVQEFFNEGPDSKKKQPDESPEGFAFEWFEHQYDWGVEPKEIQRIKETAFESCWRFYCKHGVAPKDGAVSREEFYNVWNDILKKGLAEWQRYETTNPQPKRETPTVPKSKLMPNVSASAPKRQLEMHLRANEFPVGAKVILKKYGEGVVEANNGRIMSVRFADFGMKVFSIEIVLEKHLIELA